MESESKEQIIFKSPIADPIATDKLSGKLLQLVTKCKN